MLWHDRHDVYKASERGLASGLRRNDTQVKSQPALNTRLVGPEPSAA